MTDSFNEDSFNNENDDVGSQPQNNIGRHPPRSVDEIINTLRTAGICQHSFKKENEEYIVKTEVRKSRRSWYYSSYVIHNDKEIDNEPDLIRDETRYDTLSVDENDENKWNEFLKKAGNKHHHKCKKVIDWIEVEQGSGSKKKSVFIFFILIVLAAGLITAGTYLTYIFFRDRFKPQIKKPDVSSEVKKEPEKPKPPVAKPTQPDTEKKPVIEPVQKKEPEKKQPEQPHTEKDPLTEPLIKHEPEKKQPEQPHTEKDPLTEPLIKHEPEKKQPEQPDTDKNPLNESDWKQIDDLIKK